MNAKPNHWRTAVIAIVVVAALAGAFVWIKSAEETPDQAAAKLGSDIGDLVSAQQAAGNYGEADIRLGPETRCLINRDVGIATFMINLRNRGNGDGSAQVRPTVYFRDGGLIADKAFDRRMSVVPGVPESAEVDISYEPSRRPKACHVKVGSAIDVVIPMKTR